MVQAFDQIRLALYTLRLRIHRQLSDPHSDHRRIASGFLWVSFFVLLGKLASAAKEMAVAWRYGVNHTIDAYIFVYNIVNWPVGVWFSVLLVVLVPRLTRLRLDDPSGLAEFQGELLGLSIIGATIIGAIAFLVTPALLSCHWTGLSGAGLREAIQMSKLLYIMAPLGLIIALFSASVLALGKQLNTLFEAIPALILFSAILLPGGWLPQPLLWGSIIGLIVQLLALGAALSHQRTLPAPKFSFNSPAWQGFWSSVAIMAIGQALIASTNLVDQFFASNLGEGAVATLSYANRILALALGLGATAITRATLPVFSDNQHKGLDYLNYICDKWAKWMFIISILMVATGWVLAPYCVKILFERGAFNPINTISVASALRFGLLQFPLYCSAIVYYSLYASRGNYRINSIAMVLAFPVKIITEYMLYKSIGMIGIQLSTTIMYMTFFIVLLTYRIVGKHQKNHNY